ncbi:UNVERIFIED_CONTAM: hypothetical protein RMT77_019923 [Armadillidium vulgare]
MACVSLKRKLSFENVPTTSSLSGTCKRRKLNINTKSNKYKGIDSKISTENVSTNSQNELLVMKGNDVLVHDKSKYEVKPLHRDSSGDFNTFEKKHLRHSAIEANNDVKLKKNSDSERTLSECSHSFDKGEEFLTLKQVRQICRNVVEKYDTTLREKYNKIVIKNMEEQNESFAKFVEAQLKQYKMRRNSFENYFS